MKDRRRLLGVAVAAVVALATWWIQSSGSDQPQEPTATSSVVTDSTLPVVAEDRLPAEARATLELIDAGGPFPYDRDGVVFENREELLPERDLGYYAEYTVPTPGSDDRGARRIVAGDEGELYWTGDHYRSFERITR
jgi:ribonuclease T1